MLIWIFVLGFPIHPCDLKICRINRNQSKPGLKGSGFFGARFSKFVLCEKQS